MILRYSLYFCNNSNNAAILLPLRASKRRKAFIYGLFHECEIIPTLFRDYHLYYFISILSYFFTVLGLVFLVLFSLSFPVLQNMLQLSLLNSTRRFAPFIFPNKKAQHRVELFSSICYIQSVNKVGNERDIIHQFITYFTSAI